MEKLDKIVEELIEAPLLIAAIKDERILNTLNNLIPYSTGFEIEGNYSKIFDVVNFTSIPYIVDVNCQSSEQRFRIPNGIRGIICLYLITRQLRINCELNMDSGIHYHVDCTDVNFNNVQQAARDNSEFLMKELDSWGYRRTYNSRGLGYCGNWIKFNDLHTFEFRIGEMTFDYKLLLARIMHANVLTRIIKRKLEGYKDPTYQPCNFELIFSHLKMPYSLEAYNKGSLVSRLAEIQNKIAKLDAKPPQEQIIVRKRKHIL